MENFICNQYADRLPILNTENTKICGRITKSETIKNVICLRFLSRLQKIYVFNFSR